MMPATGCHVAAVPVRIVLQGGGARLVALMAALEELELLTTTDSPKLRLTCVAGTSAGAIAAIMLASRKSITEYRHDLRRLGRNRLDKIFKARWAPSVMVRLMAGRPILEEVELRGLLRDLFKDQNGSFERFGQLDCKTVRVIATSLHNYGRVPFGGDVDGDIIDAVMHSCAIPFAFRTHRQQFLYVDGGICSNLPAQEALERREPGERVVAFSFQGDHNAEAPTGLVGYAKALLFAAMANSVRDASEHVRQVKGEVLPLETSLGTFDFDRALRMLDDADDPESDYQAIRASVRKWLEAKLPAWEVGPGRSEGVVPGGVYRIYEKMRDPQNLILRRMAMVVTANCLKDDREDDEIEQLVELEPLERPLVCFRFALMAAGDTPVREPQWRVSQKKDQRQRDATVVWTEGAPEVGQADRLMHHGILFFHPPLEPENGSYEISQITFQKTLIGLADGKRGFEHVWNMSSQSALAEEADVVVRLPRDFPECLPGDLGERIGEVPENERPTADGTPAPPRQGQKMSAAELGSYPERGGFRAVGWRARDLRSGEYVGMLLRRTPGR